MEDDSSPFNTFGKGFKRIFGKGRWTAGEDLTEQEIMSMVNEGHENGVLQESEAEMINNIFTLDQKEAKDIMTHRKQIMALDGTCYLRITILSGVFLTPSVCFYHINFHLLLTIHSKIMPTPDYNFLFSRHKSYEAHALLSIIP